MSEKSDVYAFAVTLWELVTCQSFQKIKKYERFPEFKAAVVSSE